MSRHRLAGLRARAGWQQLLAALTVGAMLVAVTMGLVLRSGAPAEEGGTRRGGLAAATAQWNTADTTYVQAMLWHHQQAQHMASLVQGRTTRPELRQLAASIRSGQRRDLAQLTAWLRARGPVPSGGVADRTGGPAGRWFAGMMAASQLQTLAATRGQRFDFLFVDMLVEHYRGALVMADEVLTVGRDTQVELLAGRAITDSQRAIRQLTGWRRRWAEPFLRQLTAPPAQAVPASPSPRR
jgi:uncharacterized protein (DUF305 family)